MNRTLFGLIGVMLLGCSAAGAQTMVSISDVHATDASNVSSERRYRVSSVELAKVRDWQPGTGAPSPLTRDRAVAIAKAEAAKLGMSDFDESEIDVALREGHINDDTERAAVPEDACLWYYQIRFGRTLPKVTTVLVSMSGAIVQDVPK